MKMKMMMVMMMMSVKRDDDGEMPFWHVGTLRPQSQGHTYLALNLRASLVTSVAKQAAAPRAFKLWGDAQMRNTGR